MKIMDKLKKSNKIILFLLIIMCISVIFSSITVILLNENDNINVINEIETYISNLSNINYFLSIRNIFISNLFYLIILWILGISVIGIPISIFLYFIKIFSISFTISSFIMVYNFKGILISIIYIFPCQIINILIIIYLLNLSLRISFKLLHTIINKKAFNYNIISNYKRFLLKGVIFFAISSLYEIFIVPKLINLIIMYIK